MFSFPQLSLIYGLIAISIKILHNFKDTLTADNKISINVLKPMNK